MQDTLEEMTVGLRRAADAAALGGARVEWAMTATTTVLRLTTAEYLAEVIAWSSGDLVAIVAHVPTGDYVLDEMTQGGARTARSHAALEKLFKWFGVSWNDVNR